MLRKCPICEEKHEQLFRHINEKHLLLKEFQTKEESIGFLFENYKQDICSLCGIWYTKENPIKLHFVDENPNNLILSNMIPICSECKNKTKYGTFMTVSKKFSFDSAHFLPNYTGLCSKIHGHSFLGEIGIEGRVNLETGMVIDFKELKNIINNSIVEIFDHDLLNNYIGLPTAENLVVWIWEKLMFDALLKGISFVKLWETPDSCCTLTKQDMLR